MLNRIVRLGCLSVLGLCALAAHGAEITGAYGGTTTPADHSNSGSGTSYSDSQPLTVFGTVPKFNVFGVVLLRYTILGELVVTSDGTIEIGTDNSSSGGGTEATVEANAVTALGNTDGLSDTNTGSCGSAASGTLNCDTAQASTFFEFDVSAIFGDFANVLGAGTVQVSGDGTTTMTGGCVAGTGPDGDCSNTIFSHTGLASLEELRVEYAYCDTPGENDCPDLQPGINTPIRTNGAPEPGTLALLGLGLAGLAATRRRRQ